MTLGIQWFLQLNSYTSNALTLFMSFCRASLYLMSWHPQNLETAATLGTRAEIEKRSYLKLQTHKFI
jgi:hypothetical protein